MKQLFARMKKSKNIALIVGAGISSEKDIPLGYKIPIQFAEQHQDLMRKINLFEIWKKAQSTGDWNFEDLFVRALVKIFQTDTLLQNELLSWIMSYPAMKGTSSDDHAIFVMAWFNRIFRHLVTTNWDFLLEWQVEAIYDQAYKGDPFEIIEFALNNGAICQIKAERLFFLEPLDEDEYFWSPRWDIVSNPRDLLELKRWNRPLWKIHGSPFFLACPQCGSLNRWKRVQPLQVNQPCPSHPDTLLVPEITFWGQSIDIAHPQVWKSVQARLQRCDMIVASGFSGSGSDTYIRHIIESNDNSWIVNPDTGSWNITKVHYIKAKASDLATGLLEQFLT